MAKKSTIDSKAEKMVLMSSTLSIEQLSNNLEIHKSTIKKFMQDNRPDYFVEFEKLKEIRKVVSEEKEKEKITQIKTEEEKKRQAAEAKDDRIANNDSIQKLMARKEKYGVTIMTPPASERGDEVRKMVPKTILTDTVIHKMNPNKK